MLDVWSWSRGGGMGGVGYLPEAGGPLENARVNLKALAFMSSVEAEIREEQRPHREQRARMARRH
jgi:hypothetical protein